MDEGLGFGSLPFPPDENEHLDLMDHDGDRGERVKTSTDKENSSTHANTNTDQSKPTSSSSASSSQLEELLDELEAENGKPPTKDKTKHSRSNRSSSTSSNSSSSDAKKKTSKSEKSSKKKQAANKTPKLLKFPLPPNSQVPIFSQSSTDESVIEEEQRNNQQDPPDLSAATAGAATLTTTAAAATSESAFNNYNRRNNIGNPVVCLDLTSNKFVPEDAKRVRIVLRKMFGDPIDIPNLAYTAPTQKTNEVIHDLPEVSSNQVTGVPLSEAPGAGFKADFKHFLSTADFASHRSNTPQKFLTIARKDYIPFVLISVHENAAVGEHWDAPDESLARDYINHSLGIMFNTDLPCADVYEKTGKWGLFTVIFLDSRLPDLLNEFRKQLTERCYGNHFFDTYPKDALTQKSDLHILLRAGMKTWDITIIPKVLFRRNSQLLAGTLRVQKTTLFNSQETSHKGESKAEWRQVALSADEQFLNCLRDHPESKPFSLGVDAVQIRGGLRPPEPPKTLLGKRQWAPIQPETTFAPPHLPLQPLQPLQPYYFNPVEQQAGSDRGTKRGRGRASRRGRGRGIRKKKK